MIEIDGSYGEGGGQIVRTAVALAAVTGTDIKIAKIREGRPKPGLAAQHAQAIEALADICSARIDGVKPGSSAISFLPGRIGGGSFRIDIGTAGSITLLLQCLLPAMIKAEETFSLEVAGGTDVRWSPTIDYFKNVFLLALSQFGAKMKLECQRRGYYPRGGGLVRLDVEPRPLRPAHIEYKKPGPVYGISHCSNLPEHIPKRQAEAAAVILKKEGFEAEIGMQVLKETSLGSGISLWSGFKGTSRLGERGIRAEDVGDAAAKEIIAELKTPASVDIHLADQLIPYLALAGGSYTVRELSKHAWTNIWTARQFLETKISVRDVGVLKIEGVLI